ncbi:serine/threonine protein kinase [Nocardia sp. NPDC058658]|uniref:serine/threonine protein kinase n=1 Tax=Nocardia sp. NPDC058658 TaxID=3346580 RepID=UPI0036613C98
MVQLGIGELFAGYRVDGVLGQGGMGTVYLVRHPRLPMQVALKLLVPTASTDEESRLRFEQEAQVIARLEHPNIVDVYDTGTSDGRLWIAMQYVRGGDAGQLATQSADPTRVLTAIGQVADALDYAHSRGVLHRDVKPANILLAMSDAGRGERAVLTDFGIARLMAFEAGLTAAGSFTATIAFASPEQLSGIDVDHRSDQYSLACTLFTLLTGEAPFNYVNAGQVIAAHLAKEPPRITMLRPDLPPMLDGVLARGMAKAPDQRYASCGEFVAAAQAALIAELDPRRVAATVHAHSPMVPASQSAPLWTPPNVPAPGWSAHPNQVRPRGRSVKRALSALAVAIGLVTAVVFAGNKYGLELIDSLNTEEWGTRNQTAADAFPQLVSKRELGTGWRDVRCRAETPGTPIQVISRKDIFFDSGIECEDHNNDNHFIVMDFDTPERAKAFLSAAAAQPTASTSWSEPHPDSATPLTVIYSTISEGGELHTGFPGDPERARFVITFYQFIPGKTGSTVRDEVWRDAPLAGS